MNEYKVGDIITCTVTKIEDYGFFVKIDKDYKGLVHISEISDEYIRKIKYYVKQGEKIHAKILEVDKKSKKILLTIKNIKYKEEENFHKIEETPSGFKTLEKNLNGWIKHSLEQFDKEKIKN